MVESALRTKWADLEIDTKVVRTSGDEGGGTSEEIRSEALQLAGRKGLFTAEIERALVAGEIDVAVHSAKDLPSTVGEGTRIAAVLPRARVNDVLVSGEGYDLSSLPQGGCVATGSVRRQHQLRWKRSDLKIVELRGNVPTRLRKLGRDGWHAAVLAGAGLERLGLMPNGGLIAFEGSQFHAAVLPTDVFVPAGGQGIIAMQIRSDDESAQTFLGPISHVDTGVCLAAEREFLRLLQGDCNQPVGVFAIVNGDMIRMHAQVFWPDALAPQQATVEGQSGDAERLAAQLLHRINGK